MRNALKWSVVIGLLFIGGSGAVLAEDESSFKVVPVELFVCTYHEGKGSSDLDKAINAWNKWADKQGWDNYAAWTLTPYYYGPEQDFDLLWLGAGKDAVALGKAQDAYLGENAGLRAGFNEVVSCSAHVNYASVQYKAPPKGATPGDSVLTFSDCKFKEGSTFEALGTAMGEWSKHLADGGSTAGIWHWYPVYGGGGEELDFKWLEGFRNFEELGGDFERMGNGGGYKVSGELFGDLLDCDSSRAYLAKNRRHAQLR